MPDFKEFSKPRTHEPSVPSLDIDGAFDCSICHEQVESAKYYASASLLVWTCGVGHVSKIEEFRL